MTKQDIQKTALRLPRDLHTQVVESAKENNRTMNAEIVARLEDSLRSTKHVMEASMLAGTHVALMREFSSNMAAIKMLKESGESPQILTYLIERTKHITPVIESYGSRLAEIHEINNPPEQDEG